LPKAGDFPRDFTDLETGMDDTMPILLVPGLAS